MKHDKEMTLSLRWQQWRQSPAFLKNISIYLLLVFIFILSIFILFYRYKEKKENRSPVIIVNSEAAPVPAPLKNEVDLQNDRLTKLENMLSQQQFTLQPPQQLIAFELLHQVLKGRLSLKSLILYLQKNAEPWTIDILNTLSPLQESKTYDELQASLILPPPSSSSLWQHVKNVINLFVSIRELDAEGRYKLGRLEDIRVALQAHDIQKALDGFGKLLPEEQAQLSSWKQEAQNRLILENLKQKMLVGLAES